MSKYPPHLQCLVILIHRLAQLTSLERHITLVLQPLDLLDALPQLLRGLV